MSEDPSQSIAAIPHAPGPEKAVVSVCMTRPEFLHVAQGSHGIDSDCFFLAGPRVVWELLVDLADRGHAPPDLHVMAEALADSGSLETIGGPAALYELFTYAPNAQHFEQHAAILRDHKARRIAITAGRDATLAAQSDSGEAQEILEVAARAAQDALRPAAAVLDATAAANQFLDEVDRRLSAGATPGIPTGLHHLDSITGGAKPGELWVIAGPTSSGKSVLLTQIAGYAAFNCAQQVLIVSLELGTPEIVARLLAAHHTIRFDVLLNPATARTGELGQIRAAVNQFVGSPVCILADEAVGDDGDSLTIRTIAAYARLHASTAGLDLLIVDYLQLVSGVRNRGDSREQEVASVSRRLKRLARTLKIPVLTASQLNDEGKMRESRAIGQDADVVLSIVDDDARAGLKVIKNRNAQRGGLLPVRPVFAFQRFEAASQP